MMGIKTMYIVIDVYFIRFLLRNLKRSLKCLTWNVFKSLVISTLFYRFKGL